MNPKSGSAGSAVSPTAPEDPHEADTADPGEVAKIKSEQVEKQEGKHGETSASEKPHKQDDEDDSKTSWIEIELVDEDDQPVPGEKYKVTLPDESVATGTLDENGFARIDGIEPGTCQITFSNLDKDAWEKA